MRISEVTEEAIIFDNGNEITFYHDQDCCEDNFADFKQIETIAKEHDFDENLIFKAVNDSGFRFGDSRLMTFIPCYSVQNGYYSADIQIYYNGIEQLNFDCEMKVTL